MIKTGKHRFRGSVSSTISGLAAHQAKRCPIQLSRHPDRAVCHRTPDQSGMQTPHCGLQLTAREGDHEAHRRVAKVGGDRDATVP
jgi:hypothetical protein